MRKLAFIDPFMVSPAIHCFNALSELLERPMSYHMPSRFGITSLQQHPADGYVIVGSASHVTDPLEWHAPLAEFLLYELKKDRPVFGCCFGHQLLCHAMGSQVEFASPTQDKYSGLRKIFIRENLWSFKEGENFTLPVTHRQVVTSLGPGLREFGRGLPNDIVTHMALPFMSTQAHPEASRHFCLTDIQNMEEEEITAGREQGRNLIKRFFEAFEGPS